MLGMRRRSFCLLFLLLAGCGLSDYESRIDQERIRVKIFDEENKVLGDLIDRPYDVVKIAEGKEILTQIWPFDVFLRVPKDVNNKSEGKTAAYAAEHLKLYRFKGA